MLLLDSQTILEAIGRSLDEHVLPHLEDEFARVQIAAAKMALREVIDRLNEGDPCDVWNATIEAGARTIASEASASEGEFSMKLSKALDALSETASARERNKALGEALFELASTATHDPAKKLLALLKDNALAFAAGDTKYISGEAVMSLT